MDPKVGDKKILFETPYQKVHRVTTDFGAFQKVFYVNSFARRVGLLMIQGNDVLLVRQWRLLIRDLALEIPGGRIDDHETPAEAAIREGLEETCLRCQNVRSLLYFHPGLDTFDNPTYLFYSEEFEPAPPENLHKDEVSEKIWIPLDRCIRMIFEKQIVDSMTIAALLAYQTLKKQ